MTEKAMKQSCKDILNLIRDGKRTYAELYAESELSDNSVRARVSELNSRGFITKSVDEEGVLKLIPLSYINAEGSEIPIAVEGMSEIWEKITEGEPFERMKYGEICVPGRCFERIDLVTENNGETEAMVIHFPEMHVGVKSRQINKESWEPIFVDVKDNTLKIWARVDASVAVAEVHVLMTGDMITGETVFPGQPFEIDMTVVEQLSVFVNNATAYLEAVQAATRVKVTVHCVWGNHGRVSRFSATESNWDRVAYMFLRERVAHNENIVIEISDEFYKMVDIRGHTYLLTHGDSIQMYQSIPLYGLIQASLKWAGSIGPHDVMCVGHFHNTTMMQLNDTTILINGAAYKGDTWALHKLKVKTDTRYWMFGVSDNRPITWQYRVDIDP